MHETKNPEPGGDAGGRTGAGRHQPAAGHLHAEPGQCFFADGDLDFDGDAGDVLCDGSGHAWGVSPELIIGRSVFALCAPVSVGSTVILFDWLRRYDYVIHAALIYFLFFAKVPRGGQKKA